MKDITVNEGAFFDSLVRNNNQIRRDRAEALCEDASLVYRRRVEDLEMELRKLIRERENMLDLSPSDADSLVLAADFEADRYVERDLEFAVRIRNTEIKLRLARKRLIHLFGDGGESNHPAEETAKNSNTKGD